MNYFLIIPLFLILYFLLKRKPVGKNESSKVIQTKGIDTPYIGPFSGIVSYEDKIKGIPDISNSQVIKNTPVIQQEYPPYFYKVAVYVNQITKASSSSYYNSTEDYKRDFTVGDIATMRNDALSFYYERINANNQNGRNPVMDYYNHFPLSKYKTQNTKTIAIALYLVKNLGDERFTEYLIGGDEKEYLEEGRAFEAALFEGKMKIE